MRSIFLLSLSLIHTCIGCTYFEIPYHDGQDFMVGRTMELGGAILTKLWYIKAVSRGSKYPYYPIPIGSVGTGEQGISTYGFVGAAGGLKIGPRTIETYTDGMNEKGLMISAHTQREAIYQENTAAYHNATIKIQFTGFVTWVLAEFNSVEELRKTLKSGQVAIVGNSLVPVPLHLHFSVADRYGHSIVIEFINGEIQIMDNTVGVMTNDPGFKWHLYNLNQYTNISPLNPSREGDIGTVETEIGPVPKTLSNGFNLHGLPADMGPPARFVRSFYLKKLGTYNNPIESELEGIQFTTAMINNVAIPLGTVAQQSPSEPLEFTQWAVIKIPSSGKFLFRSYDNMVWKSIDLKKLDTFFSKPNESLTIKIYDGTTGIDDITNLFE